MIIFIMRTFTPSMAESNIPKGISWHEIWPYGQPSKSVKRPSEGRRTTSPSLCQSPSNFIEIRQGPSSHFSLDLPKIRQKPSSYFSLNLTKAANIRQNPSSCFPLNLSESVNIHQNPSSFVPLSLRAPACSSWRRPRRPPHMPTNIRQSIRQSIIY